MTPDPLDLTVYVDTNCFIELRDLRDLPWKEIAPSAKSIEIVVTRIVITELDRMKTDRSNDRRRNRSTKALKIIDAASDSGDFRIELKSAPVKVTLRICLHSNLPWGDFQGLDQSIADDHLVLCALIEDIPTPKLLLSVDSGPRISAKTTMLSAIKPPESWMIPHGGNAENERIKKLERELAECRATKPEIAIDFLHQSEQVNLLTFTALSVPPLPQDKQEELLFDFLDIQNRTNFVDNSYIRRSREYLSKLHLAIKAASNFNEISIRIKNLSGVTAHKLIFEVTAPADTFLFGRKSDFRQVQSDLVPPELKRPKSDRDFDPRMFPEVYRPQIEEPRNPIEFFWQERPGFGSTFASFICQEFRASQEFTGRFWISRSPKATTVAGAIAVKISATNLTGPVTRTVGLRITERETTWSDSEVQKMLPDWISKKLTGL